MKGRTEGRTSDEKRREWEGVMDGEWEEEINVGRK